MAIRPASWVAGWAAVRLASANLGFTQRPTAAAGALDNLIICAPCSTARRFQVRTTGTGNEVSSLLRTRLPRRVRLGAHHHRGAHPHTRARSSRGEPHTSTAAGDHAAYHERPAY